MSHKLEQDNHNMSSDKEYDAEKGAPEVPSVVDSDFFLGNMKPLPLRTEHGPNLNTTIED